MGLETEADFRNLAGIGAHYKVLFLQGGAIGQRGSMAPEQVRDYIEVSSIEETLPRVNELGGSVVEGKSEVPGMGWYAVITDSEGSQFGLWERMPGR